MSVIVNKCTRYPTSCPKVQAKAAESTLYPDRDRWFQAIERSCWVCAISPCNYEMEEK
jgi:hypothetical protein